jgi:hypothetical protein
MRSLRPAAGFVWPGLFLMLRLVFIERSPEGGAAPMASGFTSKQDELSLIVCRANNENLATN